jgi:beta-lactamase class A
MKFFSATLLAVLLLGVLGVNRGGAQSAPLPLSLPAQEWRPLAQCGDKRLQTKLNLTLKRHGFWQSLIDQEKMAVGLVDLANPRRPRFARVNGQTMMYGASLPKLAILLAAFQGFEDGTLKSTPEVHLDLIEMIRRSDNSAASRMVARIGLGRIETLILAPRYRFYEMTRRGGIWLGGCYRQGGEHNPEPLQGLLYAATVDQLCRFYYLLAHGRLVNPERSRQMLKILAFPDLHDKFVSILEREVPPNCLYRKSGEFRVWYSDSILVWGEDWRRYILVSMVEHPEGEQILRELVPVVEQILRSNPSPASGWRRLPHGK